MSILARMMNDPIFRLHREMDRLFESFFEDLPAQRPYAAGYPGMNLWEDTDAAYVEAELPGLSMDDLDVTVQGNELRIAGERKTAPYEGAEYQRRERATGRFARTLTIPWEVDADRVEARLQDGVLTIRLPKNESAKARRVKVLPGPAAS